MQAEYVNIKKNFLPYQENPDTRLWAPLFSINYEDILNFPNFDVALDKELASLCNIQQLFLTYAEDNEYLGWATHQSHFNREPK